ncbi:hypothetical protein Ae406Ps2_0496c [Pseudonocardia sp. Ae406_Ps2]|nr:hypothetical protein Ae406Ps2_0496c [Pseudonocardia sp. Ae406_Ps2]OLM07711.1 hypothetical protein Ae331Ps2_5421 [Pseudonocardia sp. Ae331_Ps2]
MQLQRVTVTHRDTTVRVDRPGRRPSIRVHPDPVGRLGFPIHTVGLAPRRGVLRDHPALPEPRTPRRLPRRTGSLNSDDHGGPTSRA